MLIALSAIFIVVGFGIGYGTCAHRMRKRSPSLDDEHSAIKSAFETQSVMIESACMETKADRDEEHRILAQSCEISEKSLPQLNRLIEKRAKSGLAWAHIVICSKQDKLEGEKGHIASFHPRTEGIVYAPKDSVECVGRILRDAYAKCGYDADATIDLDWHGSLFVSLLVDWSDGIDVEQLGNIEFSSQVEAFKAGVPLEDILA